ncbi:MAG: ATP-dependent sacrificial sulfur transferase LarE, partial [Thermoanaerobaculia bacterium]
SELEPPRQEPKTNSVNQLPSLQRLESRLRRHDGGLLVAFSGGVDSAVLLAVAARVLGGRAVAVTADSPSMPREELHAAIRLATGIGARHRIVGTGEIERDEYVRNDRLRCYWCKHTLFERCEEIAREEGIRDIAYGYTLDDVGDFRPGQRAASELGVHAPLHDAGLGKREIREIARELGLEVWDKPAAPCLSSRIPYGSAVTVEKLGKIESTEALLHQLGFRVCRARYDGATMRIEVERDEIERLGRPEFLERVRMHTEEIGVSRIEIDPDGFRSGKLNVTLPDEVQT